MIEHWRVVCYAAMKTLLLNADDFLALGAFRYDFQARAFTVGDKTRGCGPQCTFSPAYITNGRSLSGF